METIKDLLDKCKETTGAKNKNQLAIKTGITSQRISDYYKGTRSPDEFDCLQIAKALNRSLEEITAIVRIEAEKNEKRQNAWREYYKSIGGIAASFALLFCGSVTFIVSPPAKAIEETSICRQGSACNTNYALFAARLKWLILVVRHKIYTAFRRFYFAY